MIDTVAVSKVTHQRTISLVVLHDSLPFPWLCCDTLDDMPRFPFSAVSVNSPSVISHRAFCPRRLEIFTFH